MLAVDFLSSRKPGSGRNQGSNAKSTPSHLEHGAVSNSARMNTSLRDMLLQFSCAKLSSRSSGMLGCKQVLPTGLRVQPNSKLERGCNVIRVPLILHEGHSKSYATYCRETSRDAEHAGVPPDLGLCRRAELSSPKCLLNLLPA